MNRRSFLVPLCQLDQPQSIQWMELIAEPCCQPDAGPFDSLDGLGLDKAIAIARQVVRFQQKPSHPTAVYWANPGIALSQSEGISFALILAALAMSSTKGYSRVIVLGRLSAQQTLVDNGLCERALQLMNSLPVFPYRTCVIMPKITKSPAKIKSVLDLLEAAGIDAYPVTTLTEAVQAYMSSPCDQV